MRRSIANFLTSAKIPAGIIAVLCSAIALSAGAHDASQPYADWYNALVDNNGYGCCQTDDCHTTQAWIKGGHWQAIWHDRFGYRADQIVDVPDEKINHPKTPNPTGEAVLCIGFNGVVHCFVPGSES